jgi:GTPase SAR1 family protein
MVAASEMAQTSAAPAGMQHYVQFKDRILRCAEAFLSLEHAQGADCEELREKLAGNTFNLVVVGQFKRGKTCLINALLGVDLLPVSVVPLTSIVTILVFGEALTVRVFFHDGRVEEIPPENLVEVVTETGNPKNIKQVREVVISYPSSYLKDGVRLIDTPGVGSVYLHNTDVAYQYLPKSDAALFLLSVEQPASQAELDFLRDVRQYSHRIFFLLNKIDYLNDEDRQRSIAFSRQAIEEAMGADVKIFPISAKLALDGKLAASAELLESSQLPAFAEILHQFLLHEKGKVLLLSVANHLLRSLDQVRFQTELELKSLTTSLEELQQRVVEFEGKRRQIMLERQNFTVLLDSELERLVKTGLNADLAAFRKEIAAQMEERLDAYYGQLKELGLRELNDALESFVSSEVQQTIGAWRVVEEAKISTGFADICNQFIKNINCIVDSLLRFSSELFDISFEATEVESLWADESNYYYKVKSEPVGLEMLAGSVAMDLPKYIGDRFKRIKEYILSKANRIIFGKIKQYMFETIDIQSGRLRYDFVERLNKSKISFRDTILQKMETAIAGVSAAIEKGIELRSQGEHQVATRQTVLVEELRRLDGMRAEILAIRTAVGKLGG